MIGYDRARLVLSKLYCHLPQRVASQWISRIQTTLPHRPPEHAIHCVGDSHSSFFSGQVEMRPPWPERSQDLIPMFRSYRLGSVLAYNLCELGTTVRGREKLFTLLLRCIPPGSMVMLCFGEIDCRTQLPRRAFIESGPPEALVRECVTRYFTVAMEVRRLGYEVLIWNVIPSTRFDLDGSHMYPTFATCKERNQITILFNRCLQQSAASNRMPFISIFDKLIDGDGLTDMSYYQDQIHLSQRAMPFALGAISAVLDSGAY